MNGTPRILTYLGIVILVLMAGCCSSIQHDTVTRGEYISVLQDYSDTVDSLGTYRRIVRQQERTIDSLIHSGAPHE